MRPFFQGDSYRVDSAPQRCLQLAAYAALWRPCEHVLSATCIKLLCLHSSGNTDGDFHKLRLLRRAALSAAQNTETSAVERRLVRWDMRVREGAVQDSPVLTYAEGKDYASKTNFNCMATSGRGVLLQQCHSTSPEGSCCAYALR